MTMTVLVAGSTGYLGKFAVREFKQRGYRVRALTRSKERLGRPGPFAAPPVDEFVDEVCVDALESEEVEIGAGGPDTLTQREAAELAFEVLGRTPKVVILPIWLMRGGVKLIGMLNKQFGDLFEFVATAGEIDGVAPSVGKTTLRSYFEELARE